MILLSIANISDYMDIIIKAFVVLGALAGGWKLIAKPLRRIEQLADAQLKGNGGGSLVDKVTNIQKAQGGLISFQVRTEEQLNKLSEQQETLSNQVAEASNQLAEAKKSQDDILNTQHKQERNQRALNSRIGKVEQQIKEIQQKANITSDIPD